MQDFETYLPCNLAGFHAFDLRLVGWGTHFRFSFDGCVAEDSGGTVYPIYG